MAIHCWKVAARTIPLALLICGAAIAAAAQNAAFGAPRDVTAKQLSFAQPFRSEMQEFEGSGAFRYKPTLTDRFENDPPGDLERGSSAGRSYQPDRALRRHADWKAFIPLGAAVYTMGLLDQTATIGHGDWRINEQDPLVKPFTQVPAPVFVAGGVAFETGVNWLAWRMGRSRRWHKIWWLPQVAAVGANAYGYDISTHY
jgi:hypothetical protein